MAAGWLARTAVLALWALVAWGGLVLLSAAGEARELGLRPALARLLPAAGTSPWGWLNSLAAGLAVAAGLAGVGLFLWRRQAASKSGQPGE